MIKQNKSTILKEINRMETCSLNIEPNGILLTGMDIDILID